MKISLNAKSMGVKKLRYQAVIADVITIQANSSVNILKIKPKSIELL